MVPSVCMGGPGSHSTTGQKRVSTASMAQPRRTSPPLPLFPLFYSSALPRATERARSPRPQRKRKRGAKCSGAGRADLKMTKLLDSSPTLPTTQHTHTHSPFSPPLIHAPHLSPSTYLPPTSHMPDFIRHPEKKTGNMLLAWKMLSPHSSA